MRCGATAAVRPIVADGHAIRGSASRLMSIVAGTLLLYANLALAQHSGGRGATRSRGFICVHDCSDPSASNDMTRDDLKRFDELMAAQATAEQAAAFAANQKDLQAAVSQLNGIRRLIEENRNGSRAHDDDPLERVVERTRAGNQAFLSSLSVGQKSVLRDLTIKLVKADSDLGKQMASWRETVKNVNAPNLSAADEGLANALSDFQTAQTALAREMGMLPGDEGDLAFHLVQANTAAQISAQQISMVAEGDAIRTSVRNGRSLFDLALIVDLSDLQHNITDIFRAQLTSTPRCGERIEVRQATLAPQSPSSLAVLHLHHERWICPSGAGEMMVASGDAALETKLSLSVDANGSPRLTAELGRVDADEVFRDSLSGGSLGPRLVREIREVVISVIEKGSDLKVIMPPAGRAAATIRKAQFEEGGGGQLRLALDGQLQFSDEQTKEFAAELKQQLSARATSSDQRF